VNRWTLTVSGFLLLATALSYLDCQALSVVATQTAREYQLDNAQLGLLLSAFFYAYSALHIPMGWVLDRCNIRWTYGIAVACWSLSQMA
jgi:ACS family glucarate transporter-like MFS transporter